METEKKLHTVPLDYLLDFEEKCRIAILGQETETRMQFRIIRDEVVKEIRRRKEMATSGITR